MILARVAAVCTVLVVMCAIEEADSFLEAPTVPKYVAQVKVFLDYSAKAHWQQETGKSSSTALKADMEKLFTEMNLIFKGLKTYNMDLQLSLKDIVVIPYYIPVLKTVTNYKVSATTAVYNFQEWIGHRYHEQDFDFAMLFTGNDIYTNTYLTYGVAFDIGVACTQKGVGVVEMFGKLPKAGEISDAAGKTAHEIGHILGAKHDDDEPLCKGDLGYLMTAFAKIDGARRFNVSQCTYTGINNYIKGLTSKGDNCLLPSDIGLTAADKACQTREGSNKWFMSRSYTEYGDKMCSNLKCITWNGQKRTIKTGTAAPDGLGCGKNKNCKGGKCVQSADGDPNMPDNCPWGNQDLKAIHYRSSCEAQNCENGWQHYCCAHCDALTKEQESSG